MARAPGDAALSARRRWLLGTAALLLARELLAAGRIEKGVYRVRGDARVNGVPAREGMDVKTGDKILVGRKATGTLLPTNLLPGKHLYLLGTGTGLAPFMSLVKDPEVYDHYEKIILVHGVRHVNELAYADFLEKELPEHELMGELAREKLIYYPTVTREAFKHQGRITHLIESGKLFNDIGLPQLNAETDRVMLCGSPAMLADLRPLFETRGFTEGSVAQPGHYVIEKAFAEQ